MYNFDNKKANFVMKRTRIFSFLLAILMIITSAPLFVITSGAAGIGGL